MEKNNEDDENEGKFQIRDTTLLIEELWMGRYNFQVFQLPQTSKSQPLENQIDSYFSYISPFRCVATWWMRYL